jgi:hypothetical protein
MGAIALCILLVAQYIALSNVGVLMYELGPNGAEYGAHYSLLPVSSCGMQPLTGVCKMLTWPVRPIISEGYRHPYPGWGYWVWAGLTPFGIGHSLAADRWNHIYIAAVNTAFWGFALGALGRAALYERRRHGIGRKVDAPRSNPSV